MNIANTVKKYEKLNAQFVEIIDKQYDLGYQIINTLKKAFLNTGRYDEKTMPEVSIQKIENGNVTFLLWDAFGLLDYIILSVTQLCKKLTIEDLTTANDIRLDGLEKKDPDCINYGDYPQKIADAPAYWISPDGEILAVYHRHIHTVIDHPETFGITAEYITDVYRRYKEALGFEGKARYEIMRDLIDLGWVRIRLNEKRGSWTVELSQLIKQVKMYLQDWAIALIEVNTNRKYYTVCIRELDNDCRITEIILQDLADGKL